MEETMELKAVSGTVSDTAVLHKVAKPNPDYKLRKSKKKSANWV
jgi:hypothetical protein